MTVLEEKIAKFYQDIKLKDQIKYFLHGLPTPSRLTSFEALEQITDNIIEEAFEEVKEETLEDGTDDVENSIRWLQEQFGTKITKNVVRKILAELPEEEEEG